jgi:hypothetical protein
LGAVARRRGRADDFEALKNVSNTLTADTASRPNGTHATVACGHHSTAGISATHAARSTNENRAAACARENHRAICTRIAHRHRYQFRCEKFDANYTFSSAADAEADRRRLSNYSERIPERLLRFHFFTANWRSHFR